MDEIIEITLRVAGEFERLGIPYLVGGSLASSLHGIPRATQDVDLVARIRQKDVSVLVASLREGFYLDESAIRDAVDRRASFNLIHLRTLLKVDVFVAGDDEVSRAQMERRQQYELEGPPPRALMVASAEDVVAQKLYWYRLGDEVSDRQWSDAIGVLRVAGPRLDRHYLRHAASLLGVEDLLQRAFDEVAGLDREH